MIRGFKFVILTTLLLSSVNYFVFLFIKFIDYHYYKVLNSMLEKILFYIFKYIILIIAQQIISFFVIRFIKNFNSKHFSSKIFSSLIIFYYVAIVVFYIIVDFNVLSDMLIPELLLFFFLTILLLLLILYKKSVLTDDELRNLCEVGYTTCFYLFLLYLFSLFCVFFIYIQVHYFDFSFVNDYYVVFKFNFYYVFDTYTFISKFLVVLCFLINLHFLKYNYCFNLYKKLSVEYIPLLGFVVFVGCLAISSNDLFIIFILFEIISFLLIYLLVISFNSASPEAAIKFFFLNSFVGALGFIGILILYLINGFFSTNLDVLASTLTTGVIFNKNFLLNNLVYLKISCFLIFLNFFFKFGVFPVHIFVVDVYSALSMSSIFFVSTTLKLVYLFIFIKVIYYCFGSFMFLFSPFIMVIAIITYSLGIYGAYNETNIKKFLAYSSISHAGFMLFGLGGFNIAFNLALTLFYFMIYVFSTILLFSVILGYIDLKNNGEILNNFNDFYLLNYSISSKKFYSTKTYVLNNFFITISILVLMGLPPVIGFTAKYFIFFNLFTTGYHFLVLISLLFSVLSGIYYFSLILNI